MKFCLSILLLVLLIGFNTHGQIGPWVQIPTPGTERIKNIYPNGSNLCIETFNQGRKFLFLSGTRTHEVNNQGCLINVNPNAFCASNQKSFSFSISDNISFTSYNDNFSCFQEYRISSSLLNGSQYVFSSHLTHLDSLLINHIYILNNSRVDSIALLIFDLRANHSEIIKFPELGRITATGRSEHLDEGFLVNVFYSTSPYLLSFNGQSKKFDTVAINDVRPTMKFYSKGAVYDFWNNKLYKANINREWDEFMDGIDDLGGAASVITFNDTTLLMSTNGFYFLNNNTWIKLAWQPLFNTQKVIKAGNNIYALSSEQLYILFNNEWQPVSMTGVIRGSSGSLYANDQYMFFSNRYLSFNNGQSWFDQQRYFNSTPQNSIGSIQTMRPEAWFSLDMRNNEYFVYKSTNQGTTWQTVDRSFLGNPTTHSFSIARNSRWQQTDTLYATYGINFLRIARSTDSGNSWHDDANLNFQLPSSVLSVQGIACTLQVIGGTIFLYTNTGKLLRTASRSTPFEEVYDFGPQNNIRVEILGNADTVVVNLKPFSSNGRRFDLISTDGGRRFQEIRVPFPDQFASFALRRGQLWCANNGELSISNDLGRSFQRLYNPTDNFPFPNTAGGVATFNITDSMLFINGNHVAFYTRLPQGRVVSLAAEVQAPKEQLSLYPNPANERVFIKGLIKQEYIRVFDLKGKEVLQGTIAPEESLNIEQLPSGLYMVVVGQQRLKVLKR